MIAALHQFADPPEQLEVLALRRQEWIRLKERDDAFVQQLKRANLELQSLIRPVRSNRSSSEQGRKETDQLGSVAVLADGEARSDFPADPKPFLRAGDVVELEIDGLGRQRQTVGQA